MAEPETRGRFVWHELMSTDPQAAEGFYSRVVGWQARPSPMGGTPYTIWSLGEDPAAGLMQLPEEARASGAPSNWLSYIDVPDLEASVARASELGAATLVPPMEIPEVGQFSVLSDPQGAVFALFSPPAPPGMGEMPPPGGFSWHEVVTTDPEAALRFYGELFGWEETRRMDMGEDGVYYLYGREGVELGGMYRPGPQLPAPPHWLPYIRVDGLDGVLERARSGGGEILMGPHEVPGGDRIAVCLDPQGAVFALHEVAAAG